MSLPQATLLSINGRKGLLIVCCKWKETHNGSIFKRIVFEGAGNINNCLAAALGSKDPWQEYWELRSAQRRLIQVPSLGLMNSGQYREKQTHSVCLGYVPSAYTFSALFPHVPKPVQRAAQHLCTFTDFGPNISVLLLFFP